MARGDIHCTAVDLGHARVKIVTMKKQSDGSLHLVKLTSVEVPRPVAGQNVEDLPTRQSAALKDAIKSHGSMPGTLISCLPRHLVAARRTVIPSTHIEEISEMVGIDAERQLPFAPGEAEISFQVIEQVGDSESHLMLVGAGRKDLMIHLGIFEAVGLEPEIIDVSTLATGSTYLSLLEEGETCAVVNMGRSVTEISIIRDGRVLETRSSSCAEQKMKRTLTTGSEPEERKQAAADGDLQAWARSLAQELRRTFVGFQHESYGYPIQRVILCGGLAHNSDAVRELQMAISVPSDVQSTPGSLVQYISTEAPPNVEFATAIGLAIRGLYYSSGCINLVPRSVVDENRRQHGNRFMTNVACLCLAILFLGAASVYVKWHGLVQKQDSLRSQIADWKPRMKEISEGKAMFAELNYQLDKERSTFQVLADVFSRVPPPTTVIRVNFEKRKQVTIEGEVHSEREANEWTAMLRESPHFKTVSSPETTRQPARNVHLPIFKYIIYCRLISADKEEQYKRSRK
jgi:Tfp pilus assembly PilM family ATPase